MAPVRTVVLGITDQAVSSLTNTLAVVAVARASGIAEFASFSLGFAVFIGFVGLARGALGTSLVLHSGKIHEVRRDLSHSVLVAALLGGVCGLLIFLIGMAQGLTLGHLLLACAAPFAIAQDVLRFGAVANSRTMSALISDVAWFLAVVAGLIIEFTFVDADFGLLPWALGALLALVILAGSLHWRPKVRGSRLWWSDHPRLRLSNGYDQGLGAATSALFLLLLSVLGSAATVAGIRGASTLMGPFSLIFSSLPLVALPLLARSSNVQRTKSFLVGAASFIAIMATAVGFSTLYLPDSAGESILGESWPVASTVIPIMGVEYAGLAFYQLGMTYLRAGRRARVIGVVRTVVTVSTLLCALFLAGSGEARTVALGLVVVAWLAAAVALFGSRMARET